jgi:hypothetical protein
MSEAVKYVLENFKNISEKCFDDYGFRETLSGFIFAADIRQGNYKVTQLSKDGLTVAFDVKQEESGSIVSSEKFDKKNYTENMLELLKLAVGEDAYRIETDDFMKALKSISKLEEDDIIEKLAQESQPEFRFYSKVRNELVASLFSNCFTLSSSCYPEAIYLMENVGSKVFECKKGKLQIDLNPEKFRGIKNMEKWRRDLLNWKIK